MLQRTLIDLGAHLVQPTAADCGGCGSYICPKPPYPKGRLTVQCLHCNKYVKEPANEGFYNCGVTVDAWWTAHNAKQGT
jgi:hypothetical protein